MFLVLTVGAAIVGAIAVGGVYIYVKKKKSAEPLTPASIPAIPTPQEANLHFTPVNAPIAPVKKPGINKRMLILIAVLFNVVLIGTVIFIGKSVTQQKPLAVRPSVTPSPTAKPVLPTAVPNTQLSATDSASPTCAPMPSCVASGKCDISVPPGGWCPVPTFSEQQASGSASASPSGVLARIASSPTPTPTPTPTTKVIAIIATPSPTQIVVATSLSTTPTPTTAAVTALPETGSPLTFMLLIVPALLVAIAFVF